MTAASVARTRRALRLLLGKQRLPDPSQQGALTRARKRAASWLSSPDIVGIGVGHRTTQGIEMSEPAIVVRVRDKVPMTAIGAATIPPVLRLPGLNGVVPIDVVQDGEALAHAVCCGEGVSTSGSMNWGTLGCSVIVPGASTTPLIITCAHVLAGAWEAQIQGLGYPGDPGNLRTPLGTLALRELPQPSSAADPWPNLYEVAFISPQVTVGDALPGGMAPIGFRTTEVNQYEPVMLFGANSGPLKGRITDVDYCCNVRSSLGTFGFSGLMLYDAPTKGGDSGAVVMDIQRRIIGLHLAALPSGKAVLMPIGPILRRYKLRLPQPPAARSLEGSEPLMHNDRALAIDILARTIWGEARGQSLKGQEAVANVVMNRVRKRRPRWGMTVEKVCRAPYQFSCWNNNDPNLAKLMRVDASNKAFAICLDVARRAVNGDLQDHTSGSTHYHTIGVSPSWSVGQTPVVKIGDHLFFNSVS